MVTEKLVNYIILPDIKLIIECYKGFLTDKDVVDHKNIISQDKNYDPSFNIITDIRELEMHFLTDDEYNKLKEYVDFLKNTSVSRKVGLLTYKPNQALLTELLTKLAGKTIIEFEVFSTLFTAVNFVNVPMKNYDTISDALELMSPVKK